MKVLIRQIVYYLGHTWDNLKACTIMKMLIVFMFLISISSILYVLSYLQFCNTI